MAHVDPHAALIQVLSLVEDNAYAVQYQQAIQGLSVACKYLQRLVSNPSSSRPVPPAHLQVALSAIAKLLQSQPPGWLHVEFPHTALGTRSYDGNIAPHDAGDTVQQSPAGIAEVDPRTELVTECFQLAAALAPSPASPLLPQAPLADSQASSMFAALQQATIPAQSVQLTPTLSTSSTSHTHDLWFVEQAVEAASVLRAVLQHGLGTTDNGSLQLEDKPVQARVLSIRASVFLLGVILSPASCWRRSLQQPCASQQPSLPSCTALRVSLPEAADLHRYAVQQLLLNVQLALADSHTAVKAVALHFLVWLASNDKDLAAKLASQPHEQSRAGSVKPWMPQLVASCRQSLEAADEGAWEATATAVCTFTCWAADGNMRDTSLQQLMCVMLDAATRTAHNSARAAAWLRIVPQVMQALGLVNVLFFSRLMPLLLNWVATPLPSLQVLALDALHAVIRLTWPRVGVHVAFLRGHVLPCVEVDLHENVRVAGQRVLDLLEVVKRTASMQL